MIPVRIAVLAIFTYFAVTACGGTRDKVENVAPDSATSTKQATATAAFVATRGPTVQGTGIFGNYFYPPLGDCWG